jgi:uracil-DNA glycosylase
MSVNIEEIKTKLYERLRGTGWDDKLKTFILSSDFDKILSKLDEEVTDGRRFVPQIKYLFSAFEKCHYDKTQVVIIGQDPYPYLNVPDGMAFSCGLRKREEASLRYIFDQIQELVYPTTEYMRQPDLTHWAQQGVLLLNSALTVPIGRPSLHQMMWRPFMAFLFDILGWNKPGLIYLFMGKIAAQWAESIPDNNHKIFVSHPASAAYASASKWDSKNCFNEINKLLKSDPIVW